MQTIKEQLNEHAPNNYMNCNRNHVLDGALLGFSKSTFNPKASIIVMFINDHDARPEFAVDNGGHTREYSRLVLSSQQDLPIFGHSDVKHITLCRKICFSLVFI